MNIKDNLLRVFTMSFICMIGYIAYIAIFKPANLFFDLKPSITIVGCILLLVILYFIDKLLSRLNDKKLRIIVITSFCIMIGLQIFFTAMLAVHPSWDYSVAISQGIEFALGKHQLDGYFYQLYPNNIGIALLLGFIFKGVSFFSHEYRVFLAVGILTNIFLINLALFITYKFISKVFGKSRGALFTIFMLIVTPFYTYAQIVYTDTTTMVFTISIIYLLHNSLESKSKNKYGYLIGLGILAAIGTILKTNIIICFIAISIYLFFTDKIVEFLKKIASIVAPFIIIMILYRSVISLLIPIPYSEAGLPATHWIMMGLSGPYGDYSENDFKTSTEIKAKYGKKGVEENNIKVIKERLRDFGVDGYLQFVNTKVSFTWADGAYFAPNKLSRNPVKVNWFYEYIVGGKKEVYIYISQCVHVLMLITILWGAIVSFRRPRDFVRVCEISIMGVFLFLILWETRSRYLVCYLPILILSSFYGMNNLFSRIKS